MAKGTVDFAASGKLDGKIEWSSVANGSIANTSTVTTKLYGRRTDSYETSGRKWVGNVKVGSNTAHTFSDMGSSWADKWVGSDWVLFKTYTDTVAHNEDGTCSITISGSLKGPSGTTLADNTSSGSATVTLDTIPRQATISSAPNFTDEDNPTITYNNPAGSAVDKIEAGIFKEDGSTSYVAYREIPIDATSYTFELTDEERDRLREVATGNTLTVAFYLKTTINGESVTPFSSVTKTLTIINANPTLNPEIKDVNETTIALTGDDSKLIKFYSNAQATTGSETYKYATILSETITNGGKTKLTNTATSNAVTDSVFIFYVQDSRKNDTTTVIDVAQEGNWLDYVKLSCNTQPSNPTAEGNMTLNIKGNYWNDSFGAVDNELILQYRMGVVGAEFGEWVTLTPTIDGNTYNIDLDISGLDYQSTYAFEVQASDKLATLPVKSFKVQTRTIFDWSDEDFQFNVPVQVDGTTTIQNGNLNVAAGDISASGDIIGWMNSSVKSLPSGAGDREYWNSLPNGEYWYTKDSITIDEFMPYDYGFVHKTGTSNPGDFSVMFYSQPSGKIWRKCGSSVDVTAWKSLVYTSDLYPVGTCYTTTTKTNPSDLGMPGTWELHDKEFKAQYIYSTDTTYVTRTNASAADLRIDYDGHTITLNVKYTTSAQLTDTTVNSLTLKLNALGVTLQNTDGDYVLPHAYFVTGYTDGGECIIMINISNAGIVQVVDIIPDSYVAVGGVVYFTTSFILARDQMADSFCDKFIWIRTE